MTADTSLMSSAQELWAREPVVTGIRVLIGKECVQVIDLRAEQGPLTVGRDLDRDICVQYDRISRQHCKLVRTARDRWIIEDTDSSNGTLISLQGKYGPYKPTNWSILLSGCWIRIHPRVHLVPIVDMETEPDLSRFREQLQQTLVWHGAPEADSPTGDAATASDRWSQLKGDR